MDSIPEKLPNVNDIQPQRKVPIRIQEPIRMIENLSGEIELLTSLIRNEYISFPYCIASSNVYVQNRRLCVPAEIGITKFSFRHGIEDILHSLIDPCEDIPIVEVPNVIQFAAGYHKISYRGLDFPSIETLLTNLHEFTHIVDNDGQKEAFIFVENDEMKQMRDVFKWFKAKSTELGLNLKWRLTFVALRTLFIFLMGRLPITNMDESYAFVAFKTSIFDYSDLCYYHEHNDCRHCAISKAFIYCYILSDCFANLFGVKKLERKQDKNGTLRYVPNPTPVY